MCREATLDFYDVGRPSLAKNLSDALISRMRLFGDGKNPIILFFSLLASIEETTFYLWEISYLNEIVLVQTMADASSQFQKSFLECWKTLASAIRDVRLVAQ